MPVNDTISFGGTIPTSSIPGLNTILFEANPDGDQIEQYHFNNLAFKTLYVKPDSLNPLLDVTFDGVHILNRDIVSSKPDIVIKLKDEAKWMILDDTSLLTLSLRNPLPPIGDGRVVVFISIMIHLGSFLQVKRQITITPLRLILNLIFFQMANTNFLFPEKIRAITRQGQLNTG